MGNRLLKAGTSISRMKDVEQIYYKYKYDNKHDTKYVQLLLIMQDECLYYDYCYYFVDLKNIDLTEWVNVSLAPIQKETLWGKVRKMFLCREKAVPEKLSIGRITEIKRRFDEHPSFIKFSNNAIIHIYELVEGYGKICRYFRYITQEETEAYNETIELMNATYDDHDEELELVYRETEG